LNITHFSGVTLKNLLSKDNIIDGPDNDENYEVIFEELDQPFTDQEIEMCVKKMKNDKTPGYDNILNESIKKGKTVLLPLICRLFNVILSTGWFPEIWVKNGAKMAS
jgi:hypothetical protein